MGQAGSRPHGRSSSHRPDRYAQRRREAQRAQAKRGARRGVVLAVAVLLLVVGAVAVFFTQREPVEPVHAFVRVKTTPVDGALVTVGGKHYGETPCTVTGLPPGEVYLIVSKEGYQRASERVQIPEEGSVEVQIDLEPIVGFVSIDSNPIGAEIILDAAESLGYTPLRGKPVPIGQHTYELRLENYQPYEGELIVEENRTYAKTHELAPMGAEIQITSRPSGARIWIDGVQHEKTTPARISLPPDTYIITAYAKGFIQGEQSVELSANESKAVQFELKPGDVPQGMVLVPAGEFIFGDTSSPHERPQTKIHLESFYIDKYEVSNEEFAKVFPTHTFESGTENYPVRGVSWKQATEYAKAVGKRLPTEREWEKAARGTEGWQWPWGNTFDPTRLTFKKDALATLPVEVGEHKLGVSPYGCMNMAGNVYEWVHDWYEAYPGNNEIAAEYGQVYRVLRGGSFKTDQYATRCAARHFDVMDAKKDDYGFRCAMDVKDQVGTRRAVAPPAQ